MSYSCRCRNSCCCSRLWWPYSAWRLSSRGHGAGSCCWAHPSTRREPSLCAHKLMILTCCAVDAGAQLTSDVWRRCLQWFQSPVTFCSCTKYRTEGVVATPEGLTWPHQELLRRPSCLNSSKKRFAGPAEWRKDWMQPLDCVQTTMRRRLCSSAALSTRVVQLSSPSDSLHYGCSYAAGPTRSDWPLTVVESLVSHAFLDGACPSIKPNVGPRKEKTSKSIRIRSRFCRAADAG